jgi:hypothetical protein
MKKLIVLALMSLLVAAFSADAAQTSPRKPTLSGARKARLMQPLDKPATRLPIPADSFRA